MGDHRASIKIQFEMHGIKNETDMYVNWWDNGQGIDERIVDFFRESVEESMNKYEEELNKYRIEEKRKNQELYDKQEYARLKKKYE